MKSLRNLLTLLRTKHVPASRPTAPVMSLKPNGDKEWRNKDGQLHREDGPAVDCANGDRAWFRNGKLHREGGPAIEYTDGHKAWHRYGRLHRIDGPAIERADGYKAWFLDGEPLTESEISSLQASIKDRSSEMIK